MRLLNLEIGTKLWGLPKLVTGELCFIEGEIDMVKGYEHRVAYSLDPELFSLYKPNELTSLNNWSQFANVVINEELMMVGTTQSNINFIYWGRSKEDVLKAMIFFNKNNRQYDPFEWLANQVQVKWAEAELEKLKNS